MATDWTPPARATLIDVARAAGVSRTTASDALSQRGRVSDETRQAVRQAATRLGYTANRSARSLRTATTGAIGLYIPQVLVRSEQYMSFLYAVVEQASRFDYDVTVIVSAADTRPVYAPNVDGLVLIDPTDSDPMVNRLLDIGLPVVSSERLPSGRTPTGVVWSDHSHYTTSLLDHLASRGARRPALLASTSPSDWALTVQNAYRAWCRGASITPALEVAPLGASPALLHETTANLLRRDPDIDALIGAEDGVAAITIPAITGAGHVIGEDFLLASCVDSSTLQTLRPPVTAIDVRAGEAGAACVTLLHDLMIGNARGGTTIELPLALHVRDSTRGLR